MDDNIAITDVLQKRLCFSIKLLRNFKMRGEVLARYRNFRGVFIASTCILYSRYVFCVVLSAIRSCFSTGQCDLPEVNFDAVSSCAQRVIEAYSNVTESQVCYRVTVSVRSCSNQYCWKIRSIEVVCWLVLHQFSNSGRSTTSSTNAYIDSCNIKPSETVFFAITCCEVLCRCSGSGTSWRRTASVTSSSSRNKPAPAEALLSSSFTRLPTDCIKPSTPPRRESLRYKLVYSVSRRQCFCTDCCVGASIMLPNF